MTTYTRSGHWRRGPDGSRHWVSAHTVTRASGRGYGSYRPPQRRSLRTTPFSQRWAHPNAQCPVCGTAVYFYSNEHGSRVFFDEVGPPWPKHPCTLRPTFPTSKRRTERAAPQLYSFAEGRRQLTRAQFDDRVVDDAAARHRPPGEAWLVLDVWTEDGSTHLKLHRAYSRRPPQVWKAIRPVAPPTQSAVFIRSGKLSYVDNETLRVVKTRVEFVRAQRREPLRVRLRAVLYGEAPGVTYPAAPAAEPQPSPRPAGARSLRKSREDRSAISLSKD